MIDTEKSRPMVCRPDLGPTPLVHVGGRPKRRRITGPDLGRYERPLLPGQRHFAWCCVWYLTNVLFFQGAILGLIPSSWKAWTLRLFGAKVGRGFVCKPRVNIKHPWFLEIGENVWLGEGTWIDNHCLVRIGCNVCVSQEAYLFTGNHDWNDPTFKFFCAPIEVADGCWIGAGVTLGPGTKLPPGTVLAAKITAQFSAPLEDKK